MNYVINLYVSDIKSINRTIVVNDNLPLQLFVKSMILSMNGRTENLYSLEKNDRVLVFDDSDNLSMLKLKAGEIYQVIYNYDDKSWDLEFTILEKNEGLRANKIEIIDGSGYGICQNEDMFFIEGLISSKDEKWKERVLSHYKSLNTYFNSVFSLEENNKLVSDYVSLYEDMHNPRSFVMNVSLNGFDKIIKRKIIVNNNILIDKFCRAIIASMNGDMEHLYTIKMNKRWYDENILDERLNYLDLTVGKKFKVIYDFGDNWEFNVKVSKIVSGYHDKEFEILDGKGYGIVEDCGGIYGLYDVFNGESDYYEPYDINEFDLLELQELVNRELKMDNLHQERYNGE